MNNIFIKNLSALSQRNPALVQKIQNYLPQTLPELVQKNGAYNILYNNILLHNKQNPLAEAIEIFNASENTPVSIHLIYGLGLGYLFQVASKNSKGSVILYEPDLNILWFAFTLVDFSNDILKQNVFIASTLDEASEAIYKKSGVKNSPVLLSVPSQRKINNDNFDELVKKLKEIIGSFSLDLKFTQEKFYPSLKMLIKNIPSLLDEKPLDYFKNIYQGKTAVIVSAGPTLDRNIEALKKYRDRYVLFTVGTAVKTLFANELKPDFLCIIETYNSSRQIEGLDLSEVNFITEPYSNPALRKFSYKNIFSHIAANNPINSFWTEISNINNEEYSSKGTVSYTALNSARILGCSKIILVGQDLAYIQGQCYSKDSVYKDLSCEFNEEKQKWEITARDFEKFSLAISASNNPEVREKTAKKRLENLNNSLYYIKGINGDMIPTESVYATFIDPLVEYAQHFSDRTYINTSLIGAQIDGYENLDLETALQDSEPINNKDFSIEFNFPIERLKSSFENQLLEIEEAKKLIEESLKNMRNLDNELKRYKNAGIEVLKALKKVSVGYLYLSSDFSDKSKIFDFITIANKIDLDYEMKMTKNFTYESVKNISDKIANYLNMADSRVKKIEKLIRKVSNESLNTKG